MKSRMTYPVWVIFISLLLVAGMTIFIKNPVCPKPYRELGQNTTYPVGVEYTVSFHRDDGVAITRPRTLMLGAVEIVTRATKITSLPDGSIFVFKGNRDVCQNPQLYVVRHGHKKS